MNIAVFIKSTTLHSGYGGLETQNKVLCEGLVKRGHNVYVFSPKKELKEEKIEDNGVNYIFVDCVFKMGKFFGFFGESDPKNWVNRSYAEFKKINDTKKFDVVLAQSSSGVGIIKKKDEHSIPVVSISHGSVLGEYTTYIKEVNFLSPKNWYRIISNTGYVLKNFFHRQRDFVHGSEKVIAVSNYVRQALIDETFVQDEKVVVIHNGVDPEVVTKAKHNNDKLKLVYVGRLEKSKGLQILFEALISPKMEDAMLDIIGGGVYKESLSALVKKLGIQHRVNFLGKVPHEKVMHMLSEADVFVLPTLRVEGFPMVLVEAMLAELPLVASDIGGNSDAVLDGETGYLVSCGDSDQLVSALSRFNDDYSLVKTLGQNACKKAQAEFTVDVMIDKYLNVLNEVIE